MTWFGFGKKGNDVLDLTERYRKQQEKIKEMQGENEEPTTETSSSPVAGAFGVFGMSSTTTTSSPSSDVVDISAGVDEKRRKLARRLVTMTEKIEDLSNQIYHLQQRIEVLEKKSGNSIY